MTHDWLPTESGSRYFRCQRCGGLAQTSHWVNPPQPPKEAGECLWKEGDEPFDAKRAEVDFDYWKKHCKVLWVE